jgi:hypothetical protein
MSTTQKPRVGQLYPGFNKGKAQVKLAHCYVPAAGATDSDISYPVFCAPGNVEIVNIYCTPQAAVTGQATNYRTISAIDAGTDGAGTTVLGSAYALSNGNNLTALVKKALATNITTQVAVGNVIAFKNAKTGTGVATPGFLVTVEYIDLIDAMT